MPDMNEFNAKVIDDFRSNGGKVGGQFDGAPMVLLTTTGAKSGASRTTPLVYLGDADQVVIFASKGGSPTHPDWYHNIVADPAVVVEVGTERYEATARVVEGEERDRLYAAQVSVMPGFADYAAKTQRVIPVVVLERS